MCEKLLLRHSQYEKVRNGSVRKNAPFLIAHNYLTIEKIVRCAKKEESTGTEFEKSSLAKCTKNCGCSHGVDKVLWIGSWFIHRKKCRISWKIKLYTELSTLSTFLMWKRNVYKLKKTNRCFVKKWEWSFWKRKYRKKFFFSCLHICRIVLKNQTIWKTALQRYVSVKRFVLFAAC